MSRYWCKSCEIFIDDNKISRKQHELSQRHKGAIQRAIDELHRMNREQERANGVKNTRQRKQEEEQQQGEPQETETPHQPSIGEWEEVAQRPAPLRQLGSPLQVPGENIAPAEPLTLPPSVSETKNWDFNAAKPIEDHSDDNDNDDTNDNHKKPITFKKRRLKK